MVHLQTRPQEQTELIRHSDRGCVLVEVVAVLRLERQEQRAQDMKLVVPVVPVVVQVPTLVQPRPHRLSGLRLVAAEEAESQPVLVQTEP